MAADSKTTSNQPAPGSVTRLKAWPKSVKPVKDKKPDGA